MRIFKGFKRGERERERYLLSKKVSFNSRNRKLGEERRDVGRICMSMNHLAMVIKGLNRGRGWGSQHGDVAARFLKGIINNP